MTNQKLEPELLILDAHGIYIPQLFCKTFEKYIINMDEVKDEFADCLAGPDNEFYWDSWDYILDNVELKNDNGDKMTIGYIPDLCDLYAFPENFDFSQYE